MGRKVEFNYDRAIEQATLLFWKHGYSNTPLRALLKVMKIGEGSFYNTVGSKKKLYLECLKHYRKIVGDKREAILFSQPTAKQGVRALYKSLLDDMDDPKRPRLCLMAGSISVDVLSEPDLRDYLVTQMTAYGKRVIERLTIGKQAGEFPDSFDPAVTAQIMGLYMQGLLRAVLIRYDRKNIEHHMDVFLSGLGL